MPGLVPGIHAFQILVVGQYEKDAITRFVERSYRDYL